MFFLTLDYVKIGWGIKCGGEYFPHKVIKMSQGKKLLMIECWNEKWLLSEKRATKDKREKNQRKKKGLFLKLSSIILSTLLFQKHWNPKKNKKFPTFALAPLWWLILVSIEACMKNGGSMDGVGCGSMKERSLRCLVWCRWKDS